MNPYDDGGGSQGYEESGWGYPQGGRGQSQRGPRDAYDASGAWEPNGAAGVWPSGQSGSRGAPVKTGSTAEKPSSGLFPIIFRLVVIVIVVVGLAATAGVELAPKLGKYIPFLRTGAQATTPPVFATYTPGPTPTTMPNFTLYSSKTDGFAFDYPTAWANTTVGSSTNDTLNQFTEPNTANVMIVERAAILDSATDAQVVQAEVNGATKQGLTLTEITSRATTEGVGGEVWQRHEYTVTGQGGAKLHLALLVCHHLGKAYGIVLISADTDFATEDTAIYEPALRSFRFL